MCQKKKTLKPWGEDVYMNHNIPINNFIEKKITWHERNKEQNKQ